MEILYQLLLFVYKLRGEATQRSACLGWYSGATLFVNCKLVMNFQLRDLSLDECSYALDNIHVVVHKIIKSLKATFRIV